MCFTIEKQKVARVAEHDITCYKALSRNSVGLCSPYQNFQWTVGVIKRVTLVRISNGSSINKGFHAGKTVAETKAYGTTAYEFVIPKGSLYYENGNQYVAEKMMLVADKVVTRTKYTKKK